jgi:hypothetical protein
MAQRALIETHAGGSSTARPGLFDYRAVPTYRCLLVMTCLVFGLAGVTRFSIDRHDLPLAAGTLVFLALTGMALRSQNFVRLGSAIEGMVLILASTMATCCLSLLLATLSLPYRDALLDSVDRAMLPGFTWIGMFQFLHLKMEWVRGMSMVYSSLSWQPFLLIASLSFCGDGKRGWRFLHAWYLTLILCLTLFALLPALGAYPFHHLSPADIPAMTLHTGWRPAEILEAVRSGELRTLTPSKMDGLIAFPSFHAAGGTLLALGYRRVPIIGKPLVVWNVVMIGTAPLIGGHYFCDILAGIAAALIATLAARRGDDGTAQRLPNALAIRWLSRFPARVKALAFGQRRPSAAIG